jgi:hypothetical protein
VAAIGFRQNLVDLQGIFDVGHMGVWSLFFFGGRRQWLIPIRIQAGTFVGCAAWLLTVLLVLPRRHSFNFSVSI